MEEERKEAPATPEELNEAAMQIILHAGNGRTYLNEALKAVMADASKEETDSRMKEARDSIISAHKIQTEMIQSTIECEEMQSTLLFSHAQDTLMTIYSEFNMAEHMIAMYRKLSAQIK